MYTALLTAIVSWISVNFDPPPNFRTGPAVEITFLRYKAFTPVQREILPTDRNGAALQQSWVKQLPVYRFRS
jgi:hypothetical protein